MVDDIVPIGESITTKSGATVDRISVPKGSIVTVSIRCMNRAKVFWGPSAKEFQPERWLTLNDDPLRAKEIQGHRHLLTFSDGPRTCLGKSFALVRDTLCLPRRFTHDYFRPSSRYVSSDGHVGDTQRHCLAGGAVGSCQAFYIRIS